MSAIMGAQRLVIPGSPQQPPTATRFVPTSPPQPPTATVVPGHEHASRGNGSADASQRLRSAIASSPGKLIAFDFDKTIMKEHLFGKYQYAPVGSIPITDSTFTDLNRFRALVQACRNHGHYVAIVTFGRKEVVDKALFYALGPQHGIDIRTPSDFGVPDGSGALGDKNTMLETLARLYGVSAAQMVLVDDDKQNIEAAAQAGVIAQWTPQGLTASMVMKVAQQVDPATFGSLIRLQGVQNQAGPWNTQMAVPLAYRPVPVPVQSSISAVPGNSGILAVPHSPATSSRVTIAGRAPAAPTAGPATAATKPGPPPDRNELSSLSEGLSELSSVPSTARKKGNKRKPREARGFFCCGG